MPERPTTGRRITWALVSVTLVPTAGCATLVRPNTMQPVTITSDPPAARVFVDGELIGVAPVAVDLNRRVAHYDLRAEKDGCPPRELRLGRSLSRWRFLPAWYFGATGAIVAAIRPPLLEMVAVTSIWIGGASLFDRWTGARYTRPRTVQLSLRADMDGESVSAADTSGPVSLRGGPAHLAVEYESFSTHGDQVSLNIKNEETHRRVRELARLAGETMTQAVDRAVTERLDRLTRARNRTRRVDRLLQIGRECAALPVLDDRTPEDMLYDERGLPR